MHSATGRTLDATPTASAPAAWSTSTTCSALPAPPLAITGTAAVRATALTSSRS